MHPLGDSAALREEVRGFVRTIEQRRGTLGRGEVDDAARRLGAALLGPVADRLIASQRILVVPDGPLHALPFAALRLPGPGVFLAERAALHVAASLTLYDQLRRTAGADASSRAVVGFGDPRYAGVSGGPRSARLPKSGLPPLPWTREELAALRELEPLARLHLGRDATEERAKSLARGTRIAHFACHAFVDDEFPLESGLALSTPAPAAAADNGLLQAWEILEDVRIDADLVTLSACESGLGQELAGEGLLGLTWAFQYAGARSVLASLWEVSDASTAELMRRFYRHLKRGLPKAEALRRAEVDLLRRRETSAPFFWAAFQLVGDWR